MNIVAIPDAPVEKPSKLIPQQVRAGFTNSMLDLSLFCPEYILEKREELKEKAVDDRRINVAFEPELLRDITKLYLEQCQKLNMAHTIAKAPALRADTEREDLYWLIEKLTVESIKISARSGCRYIIIEPFLKNSPSMDFYLSFADIAKENNIMILIRNQYRNFNGNFVRGELSEPYTLRHFVDKLNRMAGDTRFGICMDIGVCNICGQIIYEFTTSLGDKIKAVIMRENDGTSDCSMLPFSCVNRGVPGIDWNSLIRGLRAIDFDGELICDFRHSQSAVTHLLRQDLLSYAKKMIDFVAWQICIEHTIKKYDKCVMFGAGNMFSNYMKCYGKEYPPLFTCDNNRSLWGTVVDGIEVRDPEELRNIPEDCAIFICNIYYREIEEQLRKMGIQNKIEYYNDEYLPFSDFESE